MAWAPIGNRARHHDFFICGQRYSMLPALSLDGILHLDIQERSYNAQLFNEFIDGLLDNMNPFLGPNSVVVMDNASIHKSPELRAMFEARFYVFSSLKAWIRANNDFVRGELTGELTCDPYTMLWEAVFTAATPEKARGWFKDCGYF
ncbi:hypothetical protein BOTBODRAFT_121246 [Botryobasidium botryosum FD-172 SS1]|uniref:Tc1-like transposase DDE domain-containing protein n=1 Tax=Botryobasidium botryosum (strain FD-172 SS1) TaxID=930990 RepID=A0A067M4V7_BOTB1|nr:hypothetical protein BOTBODRAFT_121246 [Botryobasidium botryosum FD-172 SS1]